ncbi:MAG: GNAT family N-acetyltransferase [Lactobacillales bacterium]|jgi:predicted acetyltransferase|nr:GNAT family N-acetyltransferase [Lactobacillales bacterium]
MKLRELTEKDEKAFGKWIDAWRVEKDYVVWQAKPIETTFAEHLVELEKFKNNPPTPRIPSTQYFLFEDDEIVACAFCRWELRKDDPFHSHIGYGVLPDRRGEGLAKYVLGLALDLYRERGISRVLVTNDDWNAASQRTAIACGGVFEKEEIEPETGDRVRFYWIDLGE